MELDWRTRRLIDNLWGPTGTILFHLVLLVILLKFMTFEKREVGAEVEVVLKDIESFEDLEDLEEELEELDEIPTVVEAVAPPTVSLDQEPPDVDAVSPTAEPIDAAAFDMMEAVSPLQFRGLYATRSADGRGKALDKFAGEFGKSTEYSVKRALNWLRDHQYENGSWGPRYPVAMTGLALLTFFAHGDTTSSGDYGVAIRNGLKYLLKTQKNGMFIGGGPWHDASQVQAYEHAIGTYAICEAYGLTSIPFLRYAMEDAVQVIIDGQHEAGSWDYGYRHGPEANVDVSLAGWHIQALKAAKSAGAENKGLKTAIDSGVRGLKLLCDSGKSGMFAYSTRAKEHGPNPIMTGVATLCLQLVGHALDPEAREGIRVLDNVPFRWTKSEVPNQDLRAVADWPYYAWYYITQARFHQGGRTWVTWNKQFAPLLCGMQNADGSWGPAPDSSEAQYGPVYCTTLSTLMLEVYYRFLPTYQAIDVEAGPGTDEEKETEEEIVINFG